MSKVYKIIPEKSVFLIFFSEKHDNSQFKVLHLSINVFSLPMMAHSHQFLFYSKYLSFLKWEEIRQYRGREIG